MHQAMHASSRRAVSLCCVALLVLLAGCGSAAAAATHPTTPAPAVDPVIAAYLGVLRASYGRYNAAATVELDYCYDQLAFASKPRIQSALGTCRPLEIAARDAGQAALAQLATASPPPLWQKADVELKQAIQAMFPYYAAKVSAIDANSTDEFTHAFADIGNQALALFCDPIAQFNAGPPKLSPSLQAPYGRICNTGGGASG